MSHLKYYSYLGAGEMLTNTHGYSQSVNINGVIEISGQGGWREDGSFPKDLDEHIHQAFKNVELALKDAGGKGWEEVYSVTSYHVPMNQNAVVVAAKYFKQYAPHKPIWTAVGVPALAEEEMQIEIVVKAKTQW